MPKKWSGKAEYDPEVNLWVCQQAEALAQDVRTGPFRRGILKRKVQTRTIYDHFGKPVCKVKVSDSGNTEHEFDNHQDAVARPLPVKGWFGR